MADSKPIKIGLAGLGRAGRGMHIRELEARKDKFQVEAVCDVIEERRNQLAEQLGCKAYANVKDLIVDPDVEMVDIATRSCDHYDHAKMALEAGKDVFLEKPMTCTYKEAVSLRDISKGSEGNLYIRQNRRFEPGFQHIREIMASGILGDIYEIKLRRVSYSRRDDWQTIIEFGGGQLLNWGPHIIDHGLQFLDSPLKDIWSELKLIAAVGDAEDHLKIILKGENDRIVDLEISGGAAISEPEYLLWGTKGALKCAGNKITMKYLDPNAELAPRKLNPGTPEGGFGSPDSLPWIEENIDVNPQKKVSMSGIWDELYKAVREDIPFPVKLDEAVEIMKVVSAAKEDTEFYYAGRV
ncbi:hypothetical protein GF312_19085 [Candidatus Poribacteria bacterium]|nr:hypothetical protein [Candidatus Poribacteria bacterium]